MNNQYNVLYLLLGALVMVGAVFGALRLAGSSSGDVPAVAMSKADVEKIVHRYIVENPEVILEAMDHMKEKEQTNRMSQMRDKVKSHQAEIFSEADPLVAGNPKGNITMVEFFDYHCPYCKKVKKNVADLISQDGNIKLILKEFPILGPDSQMAAQAAVASAAQGKYWDFHLALMGADDLSEPSIMAIAKSVGIDLERLKADMKDAKVNKRLKATEDLARDIGIDATPTFFIGDEPFTGAQSLQELKEAVAAARKARPS